MAGFGMIGGMLLFWMIIIFLAVLFVNSLFQIKTRPQYKRSSRKRTTAQQILERRYARGEITQEQFNLMQQDIK
jgi:putative membrane protein